LNKRSKNTVYHGPTAAVVQFCLSRIGTSSPHNSTTSLKLHFKTNEKMKYTIGAISLLASTAAAFTSSSAFTGSQSTVSHRVASSSSLDMRYKVAVVGGGPSGACAAEIFAQEKGIDTVMFERKMDNAKPCGGAIPLCMVGEFDLPETVVDRKVSLNFAMRQSCCIRVYYCERLFILVGTSIISSRLKFWNFWRTCGARSYDNTALYDSFYQLVLKQTRLLLIDLTR